MGYNHNIAGSAGTVTAAATIAASSFFHIRVLLLIAIQDKLERREYTNLAQVESDCKRLVNNAKAYNDKRSPVYEDAERLRKTASNWMVKHNPAYRDGNYIAVATPIPGEENSLPGKPIPRIASTPRTVHSSAATHPLHFRMQTIIQISMERRSSKHKNRLSKSLLNMWSLSRLSTLFLYPSG
jgi:hypothetical protein